MDHSLDNQETISNEYYESNYKINLQFRAIRRTDGHQIVTVDETKLCCPVLKKRRFLKLDYSLPFGYKQ